MTTGIKVLLGAFFLLCVAIAAMFYMGYSARERAEEARRAEAQRLESMTAEERAAEAATEAESAEDRVNNSAAGTLGVALVFLWLLGLAIYFFPAFIAMMRHHPNATAIFFLDLFLAWTLIGWVAAFVWSVMTIREPA